MVGERLTFKPRSGGMVLVFAGADARMDADDSLGEGWGGYRLRSLFGFVVQADAGQERSTECRPISAFHQCDVSGEDDEEDGRIARARGVFVTVATVMNKQRAQRCDTQ